MLLYTLHSPPFFFIIYLFVPPLIIRASRKSFAQSFRKNLLKKIPNISLFVKSDSENYSEYNVCMLFLPIRTRPFLPPQDDLYELIDTHVPALQEGDVLIITSKILAIHQGRCVKIEDSVNKDDLILQEAEKYIPRSEVPKGYVLLTVKQNTLIPSAGIDESNGNGYYILWPEKIQQSAKEIWEYLKKKFTLGNVGVIITDSHTIPLRYGVVGISIGFYGIKPFKDYRGMQDIFGRTLTMTRSNIVDALAGIAVLLMGEGREQTPMLVLHGADFLEFTDEDVYHTFVIPADEDIYMPLLKTFHEKE